MTTTTDEQIEQLERHLPERAKAWAAILALYGSTQKIVVNTAELDFIPSTTIGGAAGPFLTLLAKGYGILRAAGEDDASLRTRIRNVADNQTRSAILDAIDTLLEERGGAGTTPAIMIEHFERRTVLDTSNVDFAFILDNSFLVDKLNSFILIVPDFGDLTDSVYASIIAEVNRLRAAGVRWSLVVSGAP